MSTERTPFFTSDLHFFHENIIKFCNRPFKNAKEMNEALVDNWNSVVTPQDVTYILGDVSFGKPDETRSIIRQLNGSKILIKGNHDRIEDLAPVMTTITPYMRSRIQGIEVVMFHYPIESWDKQYHGAIHLHGHMHCNRLLDPNIPNRFDVGADANGYTPVSLREIRSNIVDAERVRAYLDMHRSRWIEQRPD